MRGLQSRKPCRIPSRVVRMISLLIFPADSPASPSSSDASGTVKSSRITATPRIGSWQSGPCAVASWNAYEILSVRAWAVTLRFCAVAAAGASSSKIVDSELWKLASSVGRTLITAYMCLQIWPFVASIKRLGPFRRGPKATTLSVRSFHTSRSPFAAAKADLRPAVRSCNAFCEWS